MIHFKRNASRRQVIWNNAEQRSRKGNFGVARSALRMSLQGRQYEVHRIDKLPFKVIFWQPAGHRPIAARYHPSDQRPQRPKTGSKSKLAKSLTTNQDTALQNSL